MPQAGGGGGVGGGKGGKGKGKKGKGKSRASSEPEDKEVDQVTIYSGPIFMLKSSNLSCPMIDWRHPDCNDAFRRVSRHCCVLGEQGGFFPFILG